MSQRNDDREEGTFERMGEQLGGAAGRAFGRGGDMAAGMVGSILGSAISTLGDWWSSADANRAAASFEERDRDCREHFQASGSVGTGRDYADVRPLYQLGHMAGQNPDYEGRSFQEVEPDLQRAWDAEPRDRHGDWPEVRGYVGFGFGEDPLERDVP
jgi:hypothetical protein